jgi:polyisoprenoid-binding protein YceI
MCFGRVIVIIRKKINMKKIIIFCAAILCAITSVNAQKYFTKTGYVGFHSHTDIEDIKGDNNVASIVLDAGTAALQVGILVKSFHFEKALMEEHFNENYMESTKFPKANFSGKVNNMADINLKKDGTYTGQISGSLTIHGVTKPVNTTATFKVVGGKISAETKFVVNPKDYGIEIPEVVKKQISEKVEITVKAKLEELVK